MSPTATISIDAMGGDRGPAPVLAGLARVLSARSDLRFLLHGRREDIEPLLRRRPALAAVAELRPCSDIVRMTDQPARTLRERRDSSMWRALESVRDGEAQVAVSSGNTGALLAMSVLILRKAPGVMRPAIAVHWPAERESGYTIVLDVGADLRTDPAQLAQYAVMGSEYARLTLGLACPRVGLLNLGTEPNKGPEWLQEAARLIAAAARRDPGRMAYVGFVEGGDLVGERADVVVTDGFTGNVALKTAEGTASFLRSTLKQAFRKTWLSRLAGLFALTSLRRLQARIDPRRVNGGVFLGLGGAVIKSHGAADALGFAAAVGLAAKMARTDFTAQLAAQLALLDMKGGEGPPNR